MQAADGANHTSMADILGDFSPDRMGYNTLILGRSGSGKTHAVQAAVTDPKWKVPCYVTDFSGEYLELAQTQPAAAEVLTGMEEHLPKAVLNILDMSGEPPASRPKILSNLVLRLWNEALSDPRPRLIIIDEAADMLDHPDAASILEHTSKQSRSRQLGMILVSQDVERFTGPKADPDGIRSSDGETDPRTRVGRRLFTNSSNKLFMAHTPSMADELAPMIRLGDDEIERLILCGKGEGLFVDQEGEKTWVSAPG